MYPSVIYVVVLQLKTSHTNINVGVKCNNKTNSNGHWHRAPQLCFLGKFKTSP